MVLTPITMTQQDRINRLNARRQARQANALASNSVVPPVAPVVPSVTTNTTSTTATSTTATPKPKNILSVTDRGGMDAPIEQRNPYAKVVGAKVPTPQNNKIDIAGTYKPQESTIDYNKASLDDLEDEMIRTRYNIDKKGIQSADDLINIRKLERAMENRKTEAQKSQSNFYTSELEKQIAETEAKKKAKSDELNAQNLSQIELFKKNQQALLDTAISDINDSATRQRNATVGNLAQKGFGRSSSTEQAEIRAEENRQRAVAAATAQRDLAVQQEQARLDGASDEVLSAYDEQISTLGRNIGAYKQQSALEAQAGKEEAGANFSAQMQQLLSASRSAGIEIDPNDEKVIEQYIRIARNTDGSVNKEVIAGLSENMQAIITAGVKNGVGIEKKEPEKPFEAKIVIVGGTKKAPVYGYYDPKQGKVVAINGTNHTPGQTIRVGGSGGGVSSGGGASGGTGGVAVTTKPSDEGRIALEQSLTAKGLTKQQRADLLNLYNSQGLTGLRTYAFNNLMGAEGKQKFNSFNSGGGVLSNVGSQIKPGDSFGRWKDRGNSALKFAGLGDERYEAIKQQIEFAQAPIKNKLYGAALTPSEADIANRFLINFKGDNDTIVKMKAKNLAGVMKYVNDYETNTILGIQKPNFYDYVSMSDLSGGGSNKTTNTQTKNTNTQSQTNNNNTQTKSKQSNTTKTPLSFLDEL